MKEVIRLTFEELLQEVEPALQRYVSFQIGNRQDVEEKITLYG